MILSESWRGLVGQVLRPSWICDQPMKASHACHIKITNESGCRVKRPEHLTGNYANETRKVHGI